MALAAILAVLAGLSFSAEAETSTNVNATVVMVQRAESIKGARADAAVVGKMVSDAMRSLTGESDEAAAWRSLVNSNDVVGIKVSTDLAPLHATHREVVDAVARGLHAAGVSADKIIVWDLDAAKMREAGFDVSGTGSNALYRVEAVKPDGWDAEGFYQNVLVGQLIWGDLLFGREDQQLNTRSHLPRLLTKTVTKLINVPVWGDHDPCGFRGGLYSLSVGGLDNTRRFERMGQNGNPSIAEICAMPVIRNKLVLTVTDALVVGYGGGTGFKPRNAWNHGALYVSRDPVAVDAIGLGLVDEKRAASKFPLVAPLAGHIPSAVRLGLGVSDRERIEVRRVAP
jgi:hypothetical protein